MTDGFVRRTRFGVRVFAATTVLVSNLWAQPQEPPTEAPAAVDAEQSSEPVARELPPAMDQKGPALAVVPGGLTAEKVAQRTVASSATVRAKLAEVEATRAGIKQSMAAQYLPRVTLMASYTRLSPVNSGLGGGALVGAANPGLLTTGPCPAGAGQCVLDSAGQPVGAAEFQIQNLENNYALSAQLAVPISDYVLRLSNAIASSDATKRASVLAHQAEQLKVRTDARVLFYSWVLANGQVAVAESSLKRVQARKQDAESAYTLGSISKADLLRLEALLANTEFSVTEAETQKKFAAERLAILMGDKVPGAYQIGEDVMAPPRSTLQGALPQLTQEALSKRLELQTLRATSSALQHGSRAASAGRWPRVEANAELTYANPNQRYFPPTQRWDMTWSAGLSATWTLNDLVGGGASATQLSASARSTEAQRAALSDAIRQEVAAAYLNREKSRVAVQTSSRAVQAAAEAYRVATDLYRVGRATTTELIDAESDLFAARLGEISSTIGLYIAEAQLAHAVGHDI